MILLTSYYDNPDRKHEFDYCLKQNVKNDHIEKIILFYEGGRLPTKSKKIELLHYDRPTYYDFFDHIVDGQVNVISNTDIYFDDSLVFANRIHQNECWAITRHEFRNKCIMPFDSKPQWSQDVWIMTRKPRNIDQYQKVVAINNITNHYETIDFCMGVPGCDNHLAYLLSRDFSLRNPYHDVKCIHVHQESKRNYSMNYRITGRMGNFRSFGLLKQIDPTRL